MPDSVAPNPGELSPQNVQALAHGLGLHIPDSDLEEVTYRYTALVEELAKLDALNLDGIDPMAIFADSAEA